MKRTILLFATMACMTITSLPAQEAAVNKIIETGRSDNQVMNHLDILTNRFGGRPIGSDAYDNATEWVASKFKEWGLEVELQEAGTLPVGFNRGPWFANCLVKTGWSCISSPLPIPPERKDFNGDMYCSNLLHRMSSTG